jgi:hypothetical protein
MTLAFFCLSALDLLGALDEHVTAQDKKDWIDWVYAMQIHPEGSEHQGDNGLALYFAAERRTPNSKLSEKQTTLIDAAFEARRSRGLHLMHRR